MVDAPLSSPPRFTLAGLLELIAGIGLFLALVIQIGWLGWVMAFSGAIILHVANLVIFAEHRREAGLGVLSCAVMFAMIVALIALLLPFVVEPRESSRRVACHNNLRQLILAFHNYHDDHGHFPPPYIADANGKPMHSWRVLILPYMERSDLYKAYDLSEPWDGPNNSKLAARPDTPFQCPSARSPKGMTSYFCVVGPGRMKPGKPHQELADFTDGPTIMLVESSSAQVNWLEPRDLTVDDILSGENTAQAPGVSTSHPGGGDGKAWRSPGLFHCAMHDATVIPLRADVDRETLRALLTIDGGERVDVDDLHGAARLWPGVWVLLAAEVAFLALAIWRRVRIARRLRGEEAHG